MASQSLRPVLLATAFMAALVLTTAGALAAVDGEPPPISNPLEVVTELDQEFLILADKNTVSPKDGCHKSKAVGYRHYHDDAWNVLGECRKEGDIRYRVPDVEPVRELTMDCAEWLDWLVDGNGDAETYWGDDRTIKIKVKSLDKGSRVCLGRAPTRE